MYAHLPALPHHNRVRSFLLEQLHDGDVEVVVTGGVLHEFVHVVTDPGRFEPPVPMSEAISLARGYLGRSNVSCAPVGETAVTLALELVDRHHLGRRRLGDTLFAATLIAEGVAEVITCNPGDFNVFEELTAVDPCAKPPV